MLPDRLELTPHVATNHIRWYLAIATTSHCTMHIYIRETQHCHVQSSGYTETRSIPVYCSAHGIIGLSQC